MPTYQYQCRDCGHGFEQFQKFSDDPLTDCPECDGTVQRIIQNVGVVFKGSGWYITDSRKSGADKAAAPGKTDTTDKPASEPSEKKVAEPAKTDSPLVSAAAD